MNGELFWGYVASPAALLVIGVAAMSALFALGLHRTAEGMVNVSSVARVATVSIGGYLLLVSLLGQFILNIPISETIRLFGDQRVAWVFLVLLADAVLTLTSIFGQRRHLARKD